MLTTERWTSPSFFAPVPPELSRSDRLLRDMGRRIRQRRIALGLSQSALGEQVAERLREMGAELNWPTKDNQLTIRQATISEWERAERKPDLLAVIALAKELGLSVGKLVTGKDCG